ncbi:MAG: site-2 protease family protein [Oscillospiraceae bacterium]|nr:site-2 protease family protein [Oscillospiraceae bacterium]
MLWFQLSSLTAYAQRFLVLFTAITIHEFAHGFVADRLGDPTARNSGRLTLNPLSHLDPIGAICMVLFGFGWAKPVPFNPFYFRNRKRDTALVSLAGPAANILLAFASTIIYVPFIVFVFSRFPNPVTIFILGTLQSLVSLNIGFAVFNLIPFPPLDGSKILGAILPNSTYMDLLRYERFGFPVLFILSLTGILGRVLGVIIEPVYYLWEIFANFLLHLII